MSEVPEEISPEQPVPLVPPTPEVLEGLLPRYAITTLIAHGGMGAVYSGMQKDLERPVAIKILPPDAARDKESIDRFRTEARAMARLTHPHIPAVFDFEVVAEFCVLVMELVEGPNVYTQIRNGLITPPQALEILAQVCDAVQFAHSRGIIHGDIKPGNILLNQYSQVKLADFGLARLMGGRDSESWTPMGTPEYAAPELYDKNAVPDHRADIYSLGVVLHEMLTGSPPVGEFELPGEALGLDPRVDEIIARCMELNPDARFQTAQEVRMLAREIIEGRNVPVPEPVKAPTKRILRATRRTPAGAKIAASKKKTPPSQKMPPETQGKSTGGPRTESRPAVGKSAPKKRRKIVVVETAGVRRGPSDEAKRALLVGGALLVILVAVLLFLTRNDRKNNPPPRGDKTAQIDPVVTPPPGAATPPVEDPPVPAPPVPTPPPDPPKAKPPVAVDPVTPPPVPTPVPTSAYARIHELRITHRDEWNKKVESKLSNDLNRLSNQYTQALQKLENEYLGKGDATSVLAVREEQSRFDKTHASAKSDAVSSIPSLAGKQQALNKQMNTLRAAVKYDADAVKEKYMLGLRDLEKQMDAAGDKEGSKVVADEFQKVTKLTDTDLKNYFNEEDAK